MTAGRGALRRLAAVAGERGVPVDLREAQARSEQPIEVDEATHRMIGEVFAGTRLLQDQRKLRLLVDIRSEVRKSWADARDAFLAIGRALAQLDDMLTAAEKKRLKAGMGRLFPFSDPVASKLRRIAREVSAGRIARDQCPGSYATAYLLSILPEEHLEAARGEGLLRVDVTRREVEDFRRRRHLVPTPPAPDPDTAVLAELREREERISARIRTLLQEAMEQRRIRRQLREILGSRA